MQIPTHFKDEMEQTKLYSPQLIDVEVSIYRFFLNMEKEKSRGKYEIMLKLNLHEKT